MASTPEGPGGISAQIKKLLDALREHTDVLKGNRGDPLDRAITPRDLLDMGLAKRLGGAAQRLISGKNLVGSDAPQNMTIPPRPADFMVTGGIMHMTLTWGNAYAAFGNYAYTAIYRHTADNLADAVQIGQTSAGFIYSDHDVHFGVTYYYWIRFVSETDVKGPFNSSVGTAATLLEDPAELLERLSGAITETQLFGDLNSRINLIDAPGTGLVTNVTQIATRLNDVGGVSMEQRFSVNADAITGLYGQYTLKIDVNGRVSGFGLASTPTASTFIINADKFAIGKPGMTDEDIFPFVIDTATGQVVMEGAYIKKATITEAHITGLFDVAILTGDIQTFVTSNIGTGNITSAHIGNFIASDSFSPGVSGWKIDKDGSAEFNSVTIREPAIDRTTVINQGTAYPVGSTYTDVDFTDYRSAMIFIDTGREISDSVHTSNGAALTGKAIVTRGDATYTGSPSSGAPMCDLWCAVDVCYGQTLYLGGSMGGPTGGRIYLKVTVDGHRHFGGLDWIRITSLNWSLLSQE